MEPGDQSIAVGLYRRGRPGVLRDYSFVQVTPPSEVFQREPASVVMTPSLLIAEPNGNNRARLDVGRYGELFLVPGLAAVGGLEEHSTTTASPHVITDDRHSVKLGGLIGEDRRPRSGRRRVLEMPVRSDAPLSWRHDSRQESHLRFFKSRLRSHCQVGRLLGFALDKGILSWNRGGRRFVLQNGSVWKRAN